MGKISKRSAAAVSGLGSVCLILGVCISVISWVLTSRTPTSISYSDGRFEEPTTYIHAYWWGGLSFVVPGILGIVAGYTRNVVAMAFFLIFDILCLLASFGMSVLVGLVIVAWGEVNIQLKNDLTFEERCISYDEKICICGGGSSGMKSWTLNMPDQDQESFIEHSDGVSCEDLQNIHVMLVALVTLGALAAFMSMIASYISCCSFCNQEEDYNVAVIVQQPQQYAAPTPMVVTNINNIQQVAPQQYAPSFTHQAQLPYAAAPQNRYPATNHKARLVQNEFF